MKYKFLLILALACVGRIHAIDLVGRDHTGVIESTKYHWFTELDGTELLGQKISLDINFLPEQFIRIFSITTQAFELALDIQTDSSTTGAVENTTGYATGKNGKEIRKLSSHVGGFTGKMGIFPLYNEEDRSYTPFNPNIKTPLDIYGVHFDLTLANLPGYHITQSAFQATGNNQDYAPQVFTAFGIGPEVPKDFFSYQEAIAWQQQPHSVPDGGSTLAMLGMVLTVLVGGLRYFRLS